VAASIILFICVRPPQK